MEYLTIPNLSMNQQPKAISYFIIATALHSFVKSPSLLYISCLFHFEIASHQQMIVLQYISSLDLYFFLQNQHLKNFYNFFTLRNISIKSKAVICLYFLLFFLQKLISDCLYQL